MADRPPRPKGFESRSKTPFGEDRPTSPFALEFLDAAGGKQDMVAILW